MPPSGSGCARTAVPSKSPQTASSATIAPSVHMTVSSPIALTSAPPTAGPSSPAMMADAFITESARPRSATGTVETSQAMPAVQPTAEKAPCAKRTATSSPNVSA